MALVDSKDSYPMKMKSMINDETCSDVVFLLKNDERVHAMKGLLIGRSEYFRAMFRSNMRESTENKIEVRDCSKGVFLLFLEHLYKGEVDIGSEDAKELYVLSHRYQEDHLSAQCLGVIERELTHANVIGLMVEAESLGLDALKDVCMEYVVSNYGKSIKNQGFDSLSPSLMLELLNNTAERQP